MNTIIIHVGLHKTGTTWIQEELFRKMNVVYERRLDLPTVSMLQGSKVILSHEELSGHPYRLPVESRFAIADNLKKLHPNAKVIVGFRQKVAWVASLYSQYIRDGGYRSKKYFENNVLIQDYLDFARYEQYLRDRFENVLIYQYEDMKNDKENFVRNICSFLNEPVPNYFDIPYRVRAVRGEMWAIKAWNVASEIMPERVGRMGRELLNGFRNSSAQK